MALTVNKNTDWPCRIPDIQMKDVCMAMGQIDFDNSYPTGGESLDLSTDVPSLWMVFFEPKAGYIFEYDYANKKVKAFYADCDFAGDKALIEVANAADLSALTGVRYLAIGVM